MISVYRRLYNFQVVQYHSRPVQLRGIDGTVIETRRCYEHIIRTTECEFKCIHINIQWRSQDYAMRGGGGV